MNRLLRAMLPCFGLLLCACADHPWAPASAGSAADVIAVKAYAGPPLEGSNVAVIYGFDGMEGGDAQWICSIDGHDLQRTVSLQQRCANAVFLIPGEHDLDWRYHSRAVDEGIAQGRRNIVGSGKLHVHVEAGHVYRLFVNGARKAVVIVRQPGSPDFLLYSRINPNFTSTPIAAANLQPLEASAR